MINIVEKTVEIDGKEVKIVVRRPSNEIARKAERFRIKNWNENLDANIPTKKQVAQRMIDLGEWSDEKAKEEDDLTKKIGELERLLYIGDGKSKPKLSEGRNIAIEIRKARYDLRELISQKLSLEQNSAEALADDAKFDFLVAHCTFYKSTGKKVYNSFEEYSNKSTDLIAFTAAQALGEIMYNIQPDFEKDLPENKFLSKFGLVDEELSLIDPNSGYTIDLEGRRINEEGFYVDEDGNRIDLEGNKINQDGLYEMVEYENDLVQPKKKTRTTTKKTSDS